MLVIKGKIKEWAWIVTINIYAICQFLHIFYKIVEIYHDSAFLTKFQVIPF